MLLALTLAVGLRAQQANVNFDVNPQKNTENLVPCGATTVSPEVQDDGTITFRVKAPKAQQVMLAPGPLTVALKQSKTVAFTKDAAGLWTLTVGPIKPNIYVYKLRIDGVSVADPSNTVAGFGNQPPFSEVVVHGSTAAYYDAKPVPHGAVTRHIHHSTVTDGERIRPSPMENVFDRHRWRTYSTVTDGERIRPSPMENVFDRHRWRTHSTVTDGERELLVYTPPRIRCEK